jgi:hypothetical protein
MIRPRYDVQQTSDAASKSRCHCEYPSEVLSAKLRHLIADERSQVHDMFRS